MNAHLVLPASDRDLALLFCLNAAIVPRFLPGQSCGSAHETGRPDR
jgi:hypothetical protein